MSGTSKNNRTVSDVAAPPVLRIRDLRVTYPVHSGFLRFGAKKVLKAVDGVSFDLFRGETLGLVGESGCGKSSLGRAIIRLCASAGGSIELDGVDFLALRGEDLRRARSHVQMIFQDPYGSLDPRMTVRDVLVEPLRAHRHLNSGELSERVRKCLTLVGLSVRDSKKYPHEFSGGQRQRIAIARSLMLNPKVLIADEPVSSLDVSVQAQVLNLLKSIKAELGLSMIFISHNLSVVEYISDRIAVMYLGKIVEIASRDDIYRDPKHPYTQALVSVVPIPDPRLERSRKRILLSGEIPSPINPPKGCAFCSRCPHAVEACARVSPVLQSVSNGTRRVSCFCVPDVG